MNMVFAYILAEKKLGAPLFGLLLANQDACVPTLEPC